jgi:hypothetical protein
VYFRSILVVVLCTAFVLAFAIVLNYEAAQVGKVELVTLSTGTSCSESDMTCPSFTIASARLITANISSELGPANKTELVLGLDVSGKAAITSLRLYIGDSSAGAIQGPLGPGFTTELNLTLPATVEVTPGTTYLITVEGLSGSGQTFWASVRVAAE